MRDDLRSRRLLYFREEKKEEEEEAKQDLSRLILILDDDQLRRSLQNILITHTFNLWTLYTDDSTSQKAVYR